MNSMLNMTYAEQLGAEGIFVHFACNVFGVIRSGRGGMTVMDAKKARCRWEYRRCQTVIHST